MSTRIHYLDGIRGWAALSVLLYHVFWETFGAIFPEFRSSAFNFALNGRLAVYVFFILSGDALISPYLIQNKISVIQKLSFKRYIRLTAPILLSCMLCYLVLKLGLNHNFEAARILKREDWLGGFVAFEASLLDVIYYSTYGVYFDHSREPSYNSFLWTMSIEMLGSLLVFIFALQVSSLKKPAIISLLIAALFFCVKSYYALFFIGTAFSIMRSDGHFEKMKSKSWSIVSWLLVSLVVISCLRSDNMPEDGHRTNMLRATILIFAIHWNPRLINLLESRFSKLLGRLSFPIYLVHFSVIISLTSYLAIYLNKSGQLTSLNALFVGLFTVFFCFALAEIFSRIEDSVLKYAYIALDYTQKRRL